MNETFHTGVPREHTSELGELDEDRGEVAKLIKEYNEAVSEEQDAASRASAAAEELRSRYGLEISDD